MPTSKAKLNVLHVIPSVAACRGGPSQAVIEMVSALRKAGVNAEIATTNDNGPSKLDVPLDTLIDFHGIPVRFFNRVSPSIAAIREFAFSPRLSRWLSQHAADYDLIHVHAIFSFCSTRAMQIARKNHVPYIVRPIGQLEKWSLRQSKIRKQYYLKWFERRNLELANTVQFTAESEQSQALEVLPNLASEVIPLGLDLPIKIRQARAKAETRWSLQRDVPIILYLSRLHPKKGLELLLSALNQLHEQPYQLVIAGDGDPAYTRSLEALCTKYQMSEQCHFIGFVEGAEKTLLLQGADLFALTSFSENFGISALEAMASGTAVLLSKEVALSSLVADHQLGWVVELETADIKATLQTALADVDLTRKLGDAAHDYVEHHFQWSHVVHQLIRHYKSIT